MRKTMMMMTMNLSFLLILGSNNKNNNNGWRVTKSWLDSFSGRPIDCLTFPVN